MPERGGRPAAIAVPEYLAPGVYVEEVSFRGRTIAGVPTSTADFLARGAAVARLDRDARRALARDIARIARAVLTSTPAADRAPRADDIVLDAVDFPAFVSDLIAGTFSAVVDASVEQLGAYVELLAGVAAALDGFDEQLTECEARELLARSLIAGVVATSTREA